ncbi:MAG TPA: EboA domain-containing protein [Polyangiaceae bacterium]|nr:EboA domain-containing protein [Polyangiaceae bacterium]
MSRDVEPYLALVLTRASEKAAEWFERQAEVLSLANFAVAYAGAGRRLGETRVVLEAAERDAVIRAGLEAPEEWRLCDVGRSYLLQRVLDVAPADQHERFVARLFDQSDNREREALLKTLCMLPEPVLFLATAIDACRSHVQSVFEAIACENRYPSLYFPDPAFNQMVLKAFFTGVAVKRIVDLGRRVTPELSRMAQDYASERTAAGRPVPEDLGLVTLTRDA